VVREVDVLDGGDYLLGVVLELLEPVGQAVDVVVVDDDQRPVVGLAVVALPPRRR